MALSLFSSSEIVTRANVNQRITGVNTEIETLTPVQLYYSSNGTTGTVTLAKNITDYKAIKIYAFNSDDLRCGDVTVWTNGGSSFSATIVTATPIITSNYDARVSIQTAKVNVSGTSITWDTRTYCTISASSTSTGISTTSVKIYRVVGYKY